MKQILSPLEAIVGTQEDRITAFQHKIRSRKQPSVSWIETITEYCGENSIDVEDIKNLISPWLKARIEEEAVKLRLLKQEHRRAKYDLSEAAFGL